MDATTTTTATPQNPEPASASNTGRGNGVLNGRGMKKGGYKGRGGGGGGRGRRGGRHNFRGGRGRMMAQGRNPNPYQHQPYYYQQPATTGGGVYHAAYPQCNPNEFTNPYYDTSNQVQPTNTTSTTTTTTTTTTMPSTNFVYDTNNKAHMPVCTFYLAGRCNAGGAKCRFYHPHPDSDILTTQQRKQLLQSSSSSQQQNNNNINTNTNNNNTKRKNNAREFDPFKAEAINIAKTAQDMEIHTFGSIKGPFYSMDIECVACGYGHSNLQRYPCRVSLVKDVSTDGDGNSTHNGGGDDDDDDDNDDNDNNQKSKTSSSKEDNEDNIEIIMDEIVNLTKINVTSYMTPLTGMTAEQCLDLNKTKTLTEIRELVKNHLPKNSILVGHSIQHDIEWLGLEVGVDFKMYVDTSHMFRQRIPKNLGSASNVLRNQVNNNKKDESTFLHETTKNEDGNDITSKEENINKAIIKSKNGDDYDQPDDTHLPFPTKYRLFSLRHCCIHLLDIDIQEKAHNPIMDAKYSLLLFKKYQFATPEYLRALRDSLHRAPITLSFAAENPIIDGVVLSFAGYRLKWAGRFIWKWWMEKKTVN